MKKISVEIQELQSGAAHSEVKDPKARVLPSDFPQKRHLRKVNMKKKKDGERVLKVRGREKYIKGEDNFEWFIWILFFFFPEWKLKSA